jgi:hypothetical protein
VRERGLDVEGATRLPGSEANPQAVMVPATRGMGMARRVVPVMCSK